MEKPKLYHTLLWAACLSANPPAHLRGTLESFITQNVPPPPRQLKEVLQFMRRGMRVCDGAQALLRISELANKMIDQLQAQENTHLAAAAERASEPLRRAA